MSGHEFVAAFDDASGIDVHDDRTNIGEDTIAELRQIMARYPEPRSALLPMLHLVQSVDGRVTDAEVECLGRNRRADHESRRDGDQGYCRPHGSVLS